MTDITQFAQDASSIYAELEDVLVKKQIDYGPNNISSAPGGAENGLLVRMHDKMERLVNLTYFSEGDVNYESIDDTYADLANYCVIALMVRRGVWPTR